jgi:hypothetical protein
MSISKEIKIGYRVETIQTVKFSFEDISEEELNKLMSDPKGLLIDVNIHTNINKESSTITLDVSTNLFKSNDNTLLVHHTGRTSYYIDGLEKTANTNNTSFDLPNNLLIQLYSIAYTHARALLSVEISPTTYRNKYFLPVINPNSLIPTPK